MPTLRIATRKSKLALWQAQFIQEQITQAHPEVEVELVGITTKGDRWLSSSLSEIGGKGLFIKELEAAMLAGEADIAVHSMKDLPAQLPDGFALPVIAFREDVHDVLVGRVEDPANAVTSMPLNSVVGTSSLRRAAQLLHIRADLQIKPIRGNVDTRLSKLAEGEYDAIVLAAAGLNRVGLEQLGLDANLVHPLSFTQCLPAPGQGALGIECLADSAALSWLDALKDESVDLCVRAERGVSLGLGADCSLPIAAHAALNQGEVHLTALLTDAQGKQIISSEAAGSDPEAVAHEVVDALYKQGAQAILTTLRGGN